jgi:uncharacterized protein (TIGR03435 family)
MKRTILGIVLITSAAWGSEDRPAFEAADVHTSAKPANPVNQFVRTGPVHNGRYEIKTATMVDLIRNAYDFDSDKILEGPNWLELDRFDVTAKVPDDTAPDARKLMMQSLLRDRFKLVVKRDTRPLATYALVVGKKPQMKEAAGTEENACKPQSAGAGGEGVNRIMMSSSSGPPVTFTLGPGMTITYQCRNVTMAEFTANLRNMIGASLGPNAVVDDTGLKGKWNFDLRYSMAIFGPMPNAGERISLSEAIEKQLGLKLEERQIPTPVLVVESVNRTPTENPPGTAEALPPIPIPTEFEVATVKPTDPGRMMGRYQMQPGGRLSVEGMALRFLLARAFNTNNNDEIVGLPDSMANERYDITAKTPSGGPAIGNMDNDLIAPMLLALLKDRLKVMYHTEERPVTGYSLVAAKPKMKKADPNSRIYCHNTNPPPGSPPGSRMMKCQNITMALFAERLRNSTPDLTWPVTDATGLEGGWDFSLMFSMRPMMAMPMAGHGASSEGGLAGGVVPQASEPVEGLSIFDAVEKQLGLKLEKQKRTAQVFVIDHIEPKPVEN